MYIGNALRRLHLERYPDRCRAGASLLRWRGGALLEGLRRAQGWGRDDYPLPVWWGVVILSIVLRHVSSEAWLDELRMCTSDVA